jgi:hypothetical protein
MRKEALEDTEKGQAIKELMTKGVFLFMLLELTAVEIP